MTPVLRTALVIEVVICFAPIALQLVLGMLIAPFQLVFLVIGESHAKLGALAVISLVAAGLCGMTALLNVMSWLLYRNRTVLTWRTTLVLACIGLLPLLVLTFAINNVLGAISVIPPILCSIHLFWLARDYLFARDTAPSPR